MVPRGRGTGTTAGTTNIISEASAFEAPREATIRSMVNEATPGFLVRMPRRTSDVRCRDGIVAALAMGAAVSMLFTELPLSISPNPGRVSRRRLVSLAADLTARSFVAQVQIGVGRLTSSVGLRT